MGNTNQNYIEIKDAFKKIFEERYGYYYKREYMETLTEFPLRTVIEYFSAYKTSNDKKEFIQRSKDIFITSLMKFGFDQEFFDISRGESGIDIFANKAFNNFTYKDIREFKPITNDLDKNMTLILLPQYFNLYTNFSKYIDWGLKFILPMFLKEVLTLDRIEKSNKKDLENIENFERNLKNYVNSYEDVYKKISYIQPILAEKSFFIARTYNYRRGLLKVIEDITEKVKNKFNLDDNKQKELYRKLRDSTNQGNIIDLNQIISEVFRNENEGQDKINKIVKLLEKGNIKSILQAKALEDLDRECNNPLNIKCIYYAIPKVYIPYYEKGEKLGYLSPLNVLYFFFLIISENDQKLKRFIFDKLNIQEDVYEEEAEQQENIENDEKGQRENTESSKKIDFYKEFEGFIENWNDKFKDLGINIHLLEFNKVFTNYLEYISQKIKPKNRQSLSEYFELVILNFINEFIRIELEKNEIPSKRLTRSPKVLFDNLEKLANKNYAKFIKFMVISPAFMPYYSLEFIEKLEKEEEKEKELSFSSLLNEIYGKNNLNKIKEISKNFEKLIYIKDND